jgi:hypothetical protein
MIDDDGAPRNIRSILISRRRRTNRTTRNLLTPLDDITWDSTCGCHPSIAILRSECYMGSNVNNYGTAVAAVQESS